MTTITDLVPGAINFRDTGGLAAGESRTRSGVLYRSGNLAHLDDAGIEALTALGLRRIIDLRADDEVDRNPSRIEGLELTLQRVPLFLGSVTSFFTQDISLADMYRRIVDESAAGVVEVVRGIIEEQPVLVHCTVGKDRTGVTVALTLAAAGVDEDEVVADYARTEALLPTARVDEVVAKLREQHPEAVNLEELATRSPAKVMRVFLDELSAQYGSPAGYLSARGLADDELAELRRVLLTRE